VTIVEGLEHPWGMAFLPGNEGILVTERPGRLRLVRDSRLDPKHVAGLPEIRGRGEGGLLDVALHPAFAQNRLVYLAYSKPGARGGTTALARGRLENGRLVGVEDVFVAEAWEASEVNYGGRIVFDREGHLFLTVGDRRDMERSQDLRDHVGTTIRLHEDGRVPIDNPFVGRAGARPEIFTYGNRNAQGWRYTRQPATSGRSITDRSVGTGSTASCRAATTDGRGSVSATTTTAGGFLTPGPATAPNRRSITGIQGYPRLA
jgi:glucose/arabinose dehydrogenase